MESSVKTRRSRIGGHGVITVFTNLTFAKKRLGTIDTAVVFLLMWRGGNMRSRPL